MAHNDCTIQLRGTKTGAATWRDLPPSRMVFENSYDLWLEECHWGGEKIEDCEGEDSILVRNTSITGGD